MRVIKIDELANGVEFVKRHLIADTDYLRGYVAALMAIVDLSKQNSIEAEPVRYGRWMWNIARTRPFCSECLEEPYRKRNKKLPNFCPNCGANMNAGLQYLEELE